MVKNLKLNIKNTQLAQALDIKKLRKKTEEEEPKAEKEVKKPAKTKATTAKEQAAQLAKEEAAAAKKPRARILSAPEEALAEEAKKELEAPAHKEHKEPVHVEPEHKKEVKPAHVEKPQPEPEVVAEEKPAPVAQPAPKPAAEVKEVKKTATAEEEAKKKKGLEEYLEEEPRKAQGFRDIKEFKQAPKRKEPTRFDTRDRQGLRDLEEESSWRKKRKFFKKPIAEEVVIRPKALAVRLPITIKDLAAEMKLKASQLIAKLFMQGVTLTLNDFLDDETTVQLLGHEFECEITIDTSEEQRLRITDKTISEEVQETPKDKLEVRAPVVTFMGHVDHGKTSLIDAIRKSNVAAGEAGAITQHIGAFRTKTASGDITILDTPGHEAFSEMRERGANVTDIVVLVIAGDEGMREQTVEALNQAKEAKVPIVVALNKADKPNFDAQKVYRELSDQGLLPESWGGSTITVNCSAATGKGIPELLEMLNLQAEILELRANPTARARGTVLESEMHKGLGAVATVLVQNGTLKMGDAVVLGYNWGRIKTMHDEHGVSLLSAPPSTPVKVTGLSGLAEAGSDFIVVRNEKEARDLAQDRVEGHKQKILQLKKAGLDKLLQQKKESGEKKVLPLIVKADVQGSLEALKTSLSKLPTDKVRIEIVHESVGEISESDIELAAAAKATIIGFHTAVESHAESLIKLKKVTVRMHNIIYHAVDDVRSLMTELLDKIPEERDTGAALVKATFKSSQLGTIAGCQVTEGTIVRNNHMRVIRNKEVIWTGKIASLKRVKEDVKEVQKGFECGILLDGFSDFKEGDILQAFEIHYLKQEL